MAADMPFGPELRKRRMAAGVSLAGLAALVHYSKGYLSKIENGQRQPTRALARQCDTALNTGGALSGLVESATDPSAANDGEATSIHSGQRWVLQMDDNGSVWFQPLDRRQALATGAASLLALHAGARPGPRAAEREAALDTFTTMFGQLRAMGQRTSPALMLPTLVAQTHTLRHIATESAGRTRASAFALAARYAEYAGWMTQEAGEDRAALWWTELAVELATEGGDEELAAYSLVRRALVTMYAGDGPATVSLAQQAQRHRAASHRVRGLAAQREAQGHALLGEHASCMAALERANGLFGQAAVSEPATVLGTSTVRNPVALTTAWCLYDLGRPAEAARAFERELATGDDAHSRFQARWTVRRALAYATSGEVDRACELTAALLPAVVATDSATVRSDLRSLTRTLSRWLGHPPVRELFPALTSATHVAV
jgi:transcriptional regulator with XRE-family HTH domain